MVLALLLAGCAAAVPLAGAFRNTNVPMYSNATFDAGRLADQWTQAAAFAETGRAGCRQGAVNVWGDLATAGQLCLNGTEVPVSGRLVPIGPGRLRLVDAEGRWQGQDWWMIWVDTDYRTLAVGTPSGRFGFILNRDGPLPPDRLRAAVEIFDFNGYDTRRLAVFR